MMPRFIGLLAFAILTTGAHACRFAQDVQPAHWYEWSEALFAADVTSVAPDRSLDVITVQVVETFKGPQSAAAATLRVPSRMWASCALERPRAGERVLVALNPHGDTLLVPLTVNYSELLRRHRESAAPPMQAPQREEKPFPPQREEKPFHY